MLKRLSLSSPDFWPSLEAALDARAAEESTVSPVVSEIIRNVRTQGDAALLEYTSRFDHVAYTPQTMRVSEVEMDAAIDICDASVLEALELAATRIRHFHEKQLPQNLDYVDDAGVRLGMQWTAITDVGMYVPGGLASYPSSVLMNAIPARVAGVQRLVMVVPTPKGELNPSVLAAARLAGVDEIYKIGGAQAVAALAYGTQTIKPVYKIVGPGNAYVAEAKRQVFGKVGIDMIAGPSEILVVADGKNNPAWIAADLLSQAEHDREAQSILITDDAAFADAVDAALADALSTLARRDIAQASLENFGLCVLVPELDAAVPVIDAIAAEHVELAVDNPDALASRITNAGALFLGRYCPEALGDYVAGPSHVLPTSRTARFSSGLSVYDFMKKSSIIGVSAEAFAALAPATYTLAENEGLGAHARSVSIRSN